MRYLKYFEDVKTNLETISEDIMDICLELEDIGFEVEILDVVGEDHKSISITRKVIVNDDGDFQFLNGEYFYYGSIEEVVERLKDYLGSRFISIDYPGIADGIGLNKPINYLEINFNI